VAREEAQEQGRALSCRLSELSEGGLSQGGRKHKKAGRQEDESILRQESVELDKVLVQLNSEHTWCLCQAPMGYNSGKMVGCDGVCQGWYHPMCMGYTLRDSAKILSSESNMSLFCHECKRKQLEIEGDDSEPDQD
jgi:hypothetical protein